MPSGYCVDPEAIQICSTSETCQSTPSVGRETAVARHIGEFGEAVVSVTMNSADAESVRE